MDDLTKMIAAGVLTPVLGLVGTKVKELLEARDVRQQSRRMMDEVTNLLAFTDTLEKAAKSGGALTNIPSESLAQLQTAIAERIQAAVVHLSPPSAVKIQERHMARDIFDRVFLLHKPLVWWGCRESRRQLAPLFLRARPPPGFDGSTGPLTHAVLRIEKFGRRAVIPHGLRPVRKRPEGFQPKSLKRRAVCIIGLEIKRISGH